MYYRRGEEQLLRNTAFILLVGLVIGLILPADVFGNSRTVYLIPIHGTIEPGLAEFVERGLLEASTAGAAAVILQINTFGGRLDAATEIRDRVIASPTPIIAYVEERAWSAGALIGLAAYKLAMSTRSSIGAAEPRPADEKTVSALRAEFEATAQAQGRDPKVAAAMVDKDIAIPGLVEKGKILTLSALDAKEIGFVDLVAANLADVLKHFGFDGAQVITVQPNWAERLVRYVTEPTISAILLTMGFLGLVVELFTAGFGFPGIIGLAALGLFFGGRLVAGLAGLETVILFVVGLVLLLVEAFVTPGFGVAGIIGLAAILGSVVTSYGNLLTAAYSLTLALVLTLVGLIVVFRFFKRCRFLDKLILKTDQGSTREYTGSREKADYIGQTGVTITTCRPVGIIMVGDTRLDAVSEGPYLPAQVPVVIVGVSGAQVVVRELERPESNRREEGI